MFNTIKNKIVGDNYCNAAVQYDQILLVLYPADDIFTETVTKVSCFDKIFNAT